jgi:vacuolar protein-sorting-associated protein 4
MAAELKDRAVSLVREAHAEDGARNYDRALHLYLSGLDHLKLVLKYEKEPATRKMLAAKFDEYLTRAEELKAMPAPATAAAADGRGEARASIMSTIVAESPNVRWDDVVGLEAAKEALREAIVLPADFPHFFNARRRAWSAVLLYGPPGTGKSHLARAAATETRATFFFLSSSDLVTKWQGESERLVAQLFAEARERAPSVVFIDEIDSLCGARGAGSGETESSRRIKTEIMVQMQANNKGVVVLGATNTPFYLDPAVRRRFDKRIYVPLPGAPERAQMFRMHLGDTPNTLTPQDFEQLANAAEGFSGSDVACAVKDALFEPIRKVRNATHFRAVGVTYEPCSPGDPDAFCATLETLGAAVHRSAVAPPPVTRADFDRALSRARATVAHEDLTEHERFTSLYGEEG